MTKNSTMGTDRMATMYIQPDGTAPGEDDEEEEEWEEDLEEDDDEPEDR